MKRNEVDKALTWNLAEIFASVDEFEKALQKNTAMAEELTGYRTKIKTVGDVHEVMTKLNDLYLNLSHTTGYAELHLCEDGTDEEAQMMAMKAMSNASEVTDMLTFLDDELLKLDMSILEEARDTSKDAYVYLRDLIKSKKHKLPFEVEDALSKFSTVLSSPYRLYETTKNSDMRFPDFTVNGKTYPMTFGLYEDHYEAEADTDVRREAFRVFHETLAKYQALTAENYNNELQIKKAMSRVKGYESVFDYLLDEQDIDREVYENHIDVLERELPKVMRRFVKNIKKRYKLDRLTYADLKAPIMPEFEKKISIEESKDYLRNALKIYGDDYVEETIKYIDNRWIDFAENEGKTTGAFCSDVYGLHAYVLISWTAKMNEVFVLAHELGHAGHGRYTMRNNSYLDTNSSMYISECPSTMNEMLIAKSLLDSTDDPEVRRWVNVQLVERTYYHNFVTHGIEAIWQRKVMRLVDKGEQVNAQIMNELFRETLESFWGDEVEIIENSELTWMRQPHYYMGLYSFTYQAGLSIGTQVFKKLMSGDNEILKPYKEVLSSGGKLLPAEWAGKLGVDIKTGAALKDTIEFIGHIVDNI